MKRAFATLLACTLVAATAFAHEGDDDDRDDDRDRNYGERSIDRRLAADANGEVEVSNVAGSVSIEGWNYNEVHVTGNLDSGVKELVFESSGKRTIVKVVTRKGYHRGGGDADLRIRVPKNSRLHANTVSADLTAKGVTGPLDLQSVSGSVSGDFSGGETEAKSVSGDITLRGDGKPGRLILTTVSGTAQVTRAAGEVNASTVSGELQLQMSKVTRARMNTTSGDLNFNASLMPGVKIEAETISGQLTFDLKDTDAEIDIESFSGDIDSCTGPEAKRTQKYGPGTELQFTAGKGTGRIELQSLSGEINICTR